MYVSRPKVQSFSYLVQNSPTPRYFNSEKLYSMAEKKTKTETEKKTTVSDIRMWVVCGSGGRNIGTYPIIGVVAQNGAVWACLPL